MIEVGEPARARARTHTHTHPIREHTQTHVRLKGCREERERRKVGRRTGREAGGKRSIQADPRALIGHFFPPYHSIPLLSCEHLANMLQQFLLVYHPPTTDSTPAMILKSERPCMFQTSPQSTIDSFKPR